MSELKAEQWLDYAGEPRPCYPKSEADKVIAELEADYKEACDRLQTANLIKDEQLAATRHHKYKRCLAMAQWCDAEADVADADGDYEDMRWYQKWHQRWLKLAEQFEEVKLCRTQTNL